MVESFQLFNGFEQVLGANVISESGTCYDKTLGSKYSPKTRPFYEVGRLFSTVMQIPTTFCLKYATFFYPTHETDDDFQHVDDMTINDRKICITLSIL